MQEFSCFFFFFSSGKRGWVAPVGAAGSKLSVATLQLDELDFEQQLGVGRNGATRAARAVCGGRREEDERGGANLGMHARMAHMAAKAHVHPRDASICKMAFSPIFMPSKPRSHPEMTRFAPRGKEKGDPRFRDESNCTAVSASLPS